MEHFGSIATAVAFLVLLGVIGIVARWVSGRQVRERLYKLRCHLGNREHIVKRSKVLETDDRSTTFEVALQNGQHRKYTVTADYNIARED